MSDATDDQQHATSGLPTPRADVRVPLAHVVAHATDVAGLGANAPALLLETQSQLGLLAALASQSTERGRRPFRPDQAWADALGRVAFGLLILADQTGVDLDGAVRRVADATINSALKAQRAGSGDAEWPFE